MTETFRCYKIGFFLTNIGVFVLVRIISLCRISKWPRLDWKMQKIVHFGNLSWNNGQIQWIWCLSRNKLFLTMWEVKFATKVCNIMNYSPNTPTLMFNWCINCFNCKLHLQFVSLLFFNPRWQTRDIPFGRFSIGVNCGDFETGYIIIIINIQNTASK